MSSINEPGSRAITIPLPSSTLRMTSSRRSRHKPLEHPGGSEAGPSSSSVGSSNSSWASPNNRVDPNLRHKTHRKTASRATPLQMPFDAEPDGSRGNPEKDSARPSVSPPSRIPNNYHLHNSPLGPSMMASSSYKSINLANHADPDEPPRLICYTKQSQGFTWNDELFLPGYLLSRYSAGGEGRRRRHRWGGDDEDMDMDMDMDDIMDTNHVETCPVTEIFVTDEEAESMMP